MRPCSDWRKAEYRVCAQHVVGALHASRVRSDMTWRRVSLIRLAAVTWNRSGMGQYVGGVCGRGAIGGRPNIEFVHNASSARSARLPRPFRRDVATCGYIFDSSFSVTSSDSQVDAGATQGALW